MPTIKDILAAIDAIPATKAEFHLGHADEYSALFGLLHELCGNLYAPDHAAHIASLSAYRRARMGLACSQINDRMGPESCRQHFIAAKKHAKVLEYSIRETDNLQTAVK